MTFIEKGLLRILGLGMLYVLASPILLIKALVSIYKQFRTIDRIRSGTYPCPRCHVAIQLNRIARCAVCSATTPGSLLRCGHCGANFSTVTCDACNCTVKVR